MFRRFASVGALIGLLIPGVLLLKIYVTREAFGAFEVLLWPSSLSLLANEQYADGNPMIWVNMAESVLVNIVWYVVLAIIAYACYRPRKSFGSAKP